MPTIMSKHEREFIRIHGARVLRVAGTHDRLKGTNQRGKYKDLGELEESKKKRSYVQEVD